MTEQRMAYLKQYRKNNREKIAKKNNEYRKKKYVEHDNFRLRYNYRKIIQKIIGGKIHDTVLDAKKSAVVRLVGCDKLNLYQHIVSQFRPGMAWGNYGKVWSIDHIIPCCTFDLTNMEQVKKCFHYTNLKPVFVHENTEKGSKVI